jgi:uncharacterized protein YecA (UPF0149 family)
MQSENNYIGDDNFKKFLEHYECPTPLNVVKMKFAGAVCSPNTDLRPTDVITSLWEENKSPRLETKNEAELFFKFMMGLWDQIFNQIRQNKFKLLPPEKDDKQDLRLWCQKRYEELECGFLEGFWGGCEDLNLTAYVAQIVDSLSEMADIYASLAQKNASGDNLRSAVEQTDQIVQKSIDFIIENSVLPRIAAIERRMN